MTHTDLVPLFRCRLCSAWLFAKDTPGHLKRHVQHGEAVQIAELCRVAPERLSALIRGGWRRLFEKGRRNACPVPGMAIHLYNEKQPGRAYGAMY